jgi:hypothetical protein
MSSLIGWAEWLQDTPIGTSIRESVWVYPGLEIIHVVGLAISVGLVVVVDLRLIGLGVRRTPVSGLARQILPWASLGFFCMVLSGGLLLWSETVRCFMSQFFWIKMALLLLAMLNALIFHFTVYRKVEAWDQAPVAPRGARLAGWTSLVLWLGIIFSGRAIGYNI